MYLISACLCGVNCKYNGGNNFNEKINEILKRGEGVLVCPEQLGGMETPRAPSEIIENNNLDDLDKIRIINSLGEDKTEFFIKGAKEALNIAKNIGIKKAILKEGSPSCGVNFIYDGTFTGNKIEGMGVTARVLKSNGIDVFSEVDLIKE